MRQRAPITSLALRNVVRQRGRSAFIASAVALGVCALILTGGFIKDTIVELGDSIIYAQTGHLQVSAKGYRDAASFDPESFLIPGIDPLREQLARRDTVRQVLLRLYTAGLAGNGDSDWPVFIEGVEATREAELGSYINIDEGRRLSDEDRYGALLGAGLAEALDLHTDDWVDVVATTLDGSMNVLEFQVVGTFQTFSKDYDAHAVRIPLSAAQELLGAEGANVAVLELQNTEDTAAEQAALSTLLSSAALEVERWENLDPFYRQTVALYRQQFGFLIAIILVLVVLGVGNAISMGINERAAEFGTLRAVGTRDAGVLRLIVIEAAMLGLVGALLGVLLGNFAALAISAVGIPMPPPPNSDLGYVSLIRLSLPVSSLAFVIGALAPVLASVAPARRCSSQPVVDALRQSI